MPDTVELLCLWWGRRDNYFMMCLLSVCLTYTKDSGLRWFYNLAKGISLDFVTPGLFVYFIAGLIRISEGTGLSNMRSSRLNYMFLV